MQGTHLFYILIVLKLRCILWSLVSYNLCSPGLTPISSRGDVCFCQSLGITTNMITTLNSLLESFGTTLVVCKPHGQEILFSLFFFKIEICKCPCCIFLCCGLICLYLHPVLYRCFQLGTHLGISCFGSNYLKVHFTSDGIIDVKE